MNKKQLPVKYNRRIYQPISEGNVMAENQTEAPPPIQPPPPITPAPPPSDPESKARTWNMLCHLSILSGYIIPFGNFLGPFLIWQVMKNEVPSVETHAKAVLNFEFTVLIVLIAGFMIAFILSFFCIGYLLFPVLVVLPCATSFCRSSPA
jgi:hypothetical protein